MIDTNHAVDLSTQIEEATQVVQQHWNRVPQAGIILGTGLGNLTQSMTQEAVLSYEQIPHFPRSTAISHKGQFVFGSLAEVPIITMEGRFHAYEGYPLSQITLPVRVMHQLGIKLLIISNASGGLNPNYQAGDLMLMEDHIDFLSDNPLRGIQAPQEGAQHPDLSQPYDPKLLQRVIKIAQREQISIQRGVYLALNGPNYETRAECRFFKMLGADVVGMSTVPEVIVANQLNLPVAAFSTVTNMCLPDVSAEVEGHHVAEIASSVEPRLTKLVSHLLADVCCSAERKET